VSNGRNTPQACREAGIPCGAVLAVANRVGPDAHLEWAANHAELSARLRIELEAQGVFS